MNTRLASSTMSQTVFPTYAMQARGVRGRISLFLVLASALFLALLALFVDAPVAQAACGIPTAVGDTTALNTAIEDFNGQAGPCAYAIALTSNITLNDDITMISNNSAGVTLSIDGAGFTVDGSNNFATFDIGLGVVVSIQNITVTRSATYGISSAGVATLTNSSVLTNTDAGFLNHQGSATLVGDVISGNQSVGISNVITGTMEIQGVTVQGNQVTGINNSQSTMTVTASSLITANNGYGVSSLGMIVIQDSTIGGNTVDGIHSEGTLVLLSSTVDRNQARGVSKGSGQATISNSTISGNAAAGYWSDHGISQITNSTVTGNGEGVIANFADNVITVTNSILANSTAATDCRGFAVGPTFAVNYSLIETPSGSCPAGGTGNITGVDPDLGPLQNNGGATLTHEFAGGSAAVDAGDSASATAAGLSDDQRGAGFPRIVGSSVDMGALEAPLSYPLTVTIDGNGQGTVASSPPGINCGAGCKASFVDSTVVTLTASAGFVSSFSGWSGSGCSGVGTCIVTLDQAKSVTATFTLQNFMLSVTKSGNGTGTVTSTPAGIDCGSTCGLSLIALSVITLTPSADVTSQFAGWSGDCSGMDACVVTMDQARNVDAQFALKEFTLSVTKSGNGDGAVASDPAGIDCGTSCASTVTYGTVVTLTAEANTNSNFTGWSGAGCNGTGTCVVTLDAAKSVTADFALKIFTLTVSKSGNGTGAVTSSPAGIDCGTQCSGPFFSGEVVTLTASPNSGSSFTGWTGAGCSGTGTCTVTMDAAKSVRADFALQIFTLTVSKSGNGTGAVTSSPAGIDCGTQCDAPFFSGEVVTLTASAGSDSSFTGWSGAGCAGTGFCVVTIDAASSVTANFALRTFKLTVTKSGNSTGLVASEPSGINCGATCEATFTIGTVITMTAVPSATYTSFQGWNGGGCSGTGLCVMTMDAARNVTAEFVTFKVHLPLVRRTDSQ